MDAFARRLPYLLAWLQQALAVTEGHACGIGVLGRDAAADVRERERDEDDGLTYADPRDERKARRGAM